MKRYATRPSSFFNGKFLTSACLCGFPCRYDGKSAAHPVLEALFARGLAVPVCPEELGGLKTPRPPCEITGSGSAGRIVDQNGRDVTEQFAAGAAKTLEIAREFGLTVAVLKDGSPSCGSTRIHDGTFSSRRIPGQGLTAALLRDSGILVLSAEEFVASRFLLVP